MSTLLRRLRRRRQSSCSNSGRNSRCLSLLRPLVLSFGSFAERERDRDREGAGATLVRRFGTIWSAARGTAGTVTGAGGETKKSKRTSILGGLGGLSPRPSVDVGVEKQKENESEKTEKGEKKAMVEEPAEEPASAVTTTPTMQTGKENEENEKIPTGSISTSQSQPIRSIHCHAATILDPLCHAA